MDEAQLKAFRDATAGNLAAIDTALALVQDGYTTDQARIDTEIQAGKDVVAEQVASLTTERDALVIETNDKAAALTQRDAIITDLQAQLTQKVAPAAPVVP